MPPRRVARRAAAPRPQRSMWSSAPVAVLVAVGGWMMLQAYSSAGTAPEWRVASRAFARRIQPYHGGSRKDGREGMKTVICLTYRHTFTCDSETCNWRLLMGGKISQADYDLKGHTYDGRTCTSYLPDADVATLEDACKVVANMRFVDGHVRTAAKHPRRCFARLLALFSAESFKHEVTSCCIEDVNAEGQPREDGQWPVMYGDSGSCYAHSIQQEAMYIARGPLCGAPQSRSLNMVVGGTVSVDEKGNPKLGYNPMLVRETLESNLRILATYAEREGTCNVDTACSKCTEEERDVHRLQIIVSDIRKRKYGTEWQPMVEETCEELGTNFVWAVMHRKKGAKVMANMPKTAELKGLTLLAENQKALLREIGALKKESPVRLYRCYPKASHTSPLIDKGLVTYKQLSTNEVAFSQCVQWKYYSLGKKLDAMNRLGSYIQPLFIQELKKLGWKWHPSNSDAKLLREARASAAQAYLTSRARSDWTAKPAKAKQKGGKKRARQEDAQPEEEEDMLEKLRERNRARHDSLS